MKKVKRKLVYPGLGDPEVSVDLEDIVNTMDEIVDWINDFDGRRAKANKVLNKLFPQEKR